MPSVPSEPTTVPSRSSASPSPSRTSWPSASTTSASITWLVVKPCLRQCAPPEFSATLPPIVQTCWLEGSGRNRDRAQPPPRSPPGWSPPAAAAPGGWRRRPPGCGACAPGRSRCPRPPAPPRRRGRCRHRGRRTARGGRRRREPPPPPRQSGGKRHRQRLCPVAGQPIRFVGAKRGGVGDDVLGADGAAQIGDQAHAAQPTRLRCLARVESARQLDHHHLQQAAGAVDGHVRLRIEPGQRRKLRSPPFRSTITWSPTPSWPRPRMVNVSSPLMPSDSADVALQELQRDHAQRHQVGAVDALEALGDHRPHAQQRAALGRPVTGAARAVLLAGDHHQRHAVGQVAQRGVVDRHLLAVGEVRG